ncbi:MAG: hypothetical protein JSR33_00690 [Proteobacteria bacterium]|nr:hypothetical protein [Pseudomonadota bacterium]
MEHQELINLLRETKEISHQDRLIQVFEQNADLANYFIDKDQNQTLLKIRELDQKLQQTEDTYLYQIPKIARNLGWKVFFTATFITSACLYSDSSKNNREPEELITATTTLLSAFGTIVVCFCPFETPENRVERALRAKIDAHVIRKNLPISVAHESVLMWVKKSLPCCQDSEAKHTLLPV